jgi:hypothetical protein
MIKVGATEFTEECAKGISLTDWKKMYSGAKYLTEKEVEKAYYLCGGKSKKKA